MTDYILRSQLEIHNAGLVDATNSAIEDCVASLFSAPTPSTLYQYRPFDAAKSMISSNSLWATCLSCQKNDPNELMDAIEIVEGEIKALGDNLPPFSKLLLERVREQLKSRRAWCFISCFCDDGDSGHHWDEYGPYRFGISSDALQNLRCRDFKADHWLQPALYDENALRLGIGHCFHRVLEAHRLFIRGEFGGPWMDAMATSSARDLSHMLLRLIASFKNERFIKDREWRLFFCPNLSIANTAPKQADRDFGIHIDEEVVPHIVLLNRQSLRGDLNGRTCLYTSLASSPSHTVSSEREELAVLLKRYATPFMLT